MKASYLSLVLALGLYGVANAEEQTQTKEGESTMKIEDAAGKSNSVDGNIDEEITNRKLRAESGSKSKWSGSFTASYQGGSLEKPMDKNRANPTNSPTPQRVRLGGDIGVRYRMDKSQSLKLATGFSMERPFHEAKKSDVSDPSLSYTNAGKIGELQNVGDASVTVYTDSDLVEIGNVASLSLGDTMLYDFGGSRSSIGLYWNGYYTQYSKKNEIITLDGDSFPAGLAQEDYGFGLYPLYEYSFNDMVNFRTVFRPWTFDHARFAEGSTYTKKPWTQSIGIGVAVTRDVYLYPNFQYDWEKWRRDDFNWFAKNNRESSTVGLSATINMF